MKLLSVNVGRPQPIAAKSGQSGIFKRPVDGPVWVGRLGLSGDHILDTANHGGPEQAVYVFTQPDYDHWSARLGQRLSPGTFGENLLITDLESAWVKIGERLRVGAVLLEVTAARIPCITLATRMDDTQFIRKFRDQRRPGFYARVLEVGDVQAGDAVRFEGSPGLQSQSVLENFEAFFAGRQGQ